MVSLGRIVTVRMAFTATRVLMIADLLLRRHGRGTVRRRLRDLRFLIGLFDGSGDIDIFVFFLLDKRPKREDADVFDL